MTTVGFDGIIFGLQRVGGISTYSLELLTRLARSEWSVTLGLPRTLINDRAGALHLKMSHDLLPTHAARYLPTMTAGELVHTSYYRLPRSATVRHVVTVYDFVYERYRKGFARMVHSAQKRAACRRADAVLCISVNTARDLIATYPEIDPAKVAVTLLGVDHANFFPPEMPRTDLQNTVVFVGQRGGYKRFDLAVAAVALTDLRLAIVGASLGDAEIDLLDTSLPGRWSLLARVSDPELREIYAGCYAFLYPSDYEGFGLPILEAQACGAPAVVANLSSFPEVGGSAARYAAAQTPQAYAEQLLALGGGATRSEVTAAGLANAQLFSWDRTYALTTEAYRRVLG